MTAIRSMAELVGALRKRKDELNLSNETIDAIAGMQSGYAGKLLAPKPTRNIGYMSLGDLMGALGVCLRVVEDEAQVDLVKTRWVKRKRARKTGSPSIAPSMQKAVPMNLQITPELQDVLSRRGYMREIGLRGNLKRNSRLSRWKRSVLARRAAKARWGRVREAEEPHRESAEAPG